jgi:uncharacterized protein
MSIYLDTCIVIYVVERHHLYSASIETLMRNAGAVDFCYSPLVRLECLVMPFRTNDIALLKLYESFLGAQRLLDLPPAVFDDAARLRASHQSLKTPDAIRLAAARHHGCAEFWTNDGRLNTIAPGMARKVT